MLRAVYGQLTSVLLAASQRAHFHTSVAINVTNKRYDREKDSVRQKGVDVSAGSTFTSGTGGQQVSYDNKPLNNFAFPTLETFSQTFDGIPFNQLHIIHIKSTSNNTIVSVTDSDGVVLAIQSAGTVGFRNARKGTNVAAQAVAIALADDAKKKNVRQARVCLSGIGPGRFPALRAVEMSAIKVVSISDTTPLPHNGNRPKKVRRL